MQHGDEQRKHQQVSISMSISIPVPTQANVCVPLLFSLLLLTPKVCRLQRPSNDARAQASGIEASGVGQSKHTGCPFEFLVNTVFQDASSKWFLAGTLAL